MHLAWCTMIGFAGQSEGSVYNRACKVIAKRKNYQAQIFGSENDC